MHGAEVMARLVQGDNDPDELIAASPRMKAIKKKVAKCADSDDPMLVLGEDGTGKTLIARLIHDGSARSTGPLIAVNCRELAPGHAAELILGEDLGGRLPAGERASGGIHLAHGGTIVLRGADALEPAAQHLISAYLRGRSNPRAFPDTRFIITAREASKGEENDALTQDLTECFDEVDRNSSPRQKTQGHSAPGRRVHAEDRGRTRRSLPKGRATPCCRSAISDAMWLNFGKSSIWRCGVAEGNEIRAEHIFGGVGDDAIVPGMDITETPLMRRLLQKMSLPVLRVATLAGFAAVICLCLASASSLARPRCQHRHLVAVGTGGLRSLFPGRARCGAPCVPSPRRRVGRRSCTIRRGRRRSG